MALDFGYLHYGLQEPPSGVRAVVQSFGRIALALSGGYFAANFSSISIPRPGFSLA
jgi:hypothetical protein